MHNKIYYSISQSITPIVDNNNMDYSFLDLKFETFDEICAMFDHSEDIRQKYSYLAGYILDLYNYKIMESDSSDKLYWNEKYFANVEKNYKKANKYYMKANELTYRDLTFNLGYYYQTIEKEIAAKLKRKIAAKLKKKYVNKSKTRRRR